MSLIPALRRASQPSDIGNHNVSTAVTCAVLASNEFTQPRGVEPAFSVMPWDVLFSYSNLVYRSMISCGFLGHSRPCYVVVCRSQYVPTWLYVFIVRLSVEAECNLDDGSGSKSCVINAVTQSTRTASYKESSRGDRLKLCSKYPSML